MGLGERLQSAPGLLPSQLHDLGTGRYWSRTHAIPSSGGQGRNPDQPDLLGQVLPADQHARPTSRPAADRPDRLMPGDVLSHDIAS